MPDVYVAGGRAAEENREQIVERLGKKEFLPKEVVANVLKWCV